MRNLILLFSLLFFNLVGFAQITINLPLTRSVFQRDNNNTSSIYISGNYEEAIEKIEARLLPVKVGQGVATDWTPIIYKPQNGSFVGSIKGTGGWYQLQVRAWKNGAVISQSTVEKVGIGEVFLIAGQSNAEGRRNFGEKASVDDRVNCFDYQKIDFLDEIPPFQSFSHIERTSSIAPRGQGTWCWGELGDLLAKRLNVPIMFFNAAYEGTSIENWYSSSIGVSTKHNYYRFTFPNQTPYSYLRISLQYYISQLGLRSVLWQQGEAESELKTTQEYYETALRKIIEKSRLESGKKISWMLARVSLLNTKQIYPTVINAQNNVINPADYIFEGPYTDSIQTPRPEGVHFTDSGISDLAKAWDTKMNTRFFSQSIPFLPAPIVPLNASCQVSDKVTLSTPTSYNLQKWSNNLISSTLTASTGTYNSILRDQTGNYFFSATIDVKKVFPSAKPFIYAKKSPFFCERTSTDLLIDSPDYTSFVWNTGETQKQITVKNASSYSVKGISATGCASPESNIIQTQILSLPGKPVIYQSDVVACEGSTITLASTSLKESIWSTNETGPVITLRTVGDYQVTVRQKDENGCISIDSEPVKFTIKPRPETPKIIQSDVAACEGSTITLASTSLKESIWSTNETGPVITLRTVGDYRVTVRQKDENGCISIDSEPVTFTIKPRPETPEIMQIGIYTLEAKQKTEAIDLSYEWKQDDRIAANKTAFIKINAPSFITVTALRNFMVSNKTLTCRSNLSGAYSFVPSTELSGIIIYPNPTSNGIVTLEAKENIEDFTLTIYDSRGQFIYTSPIPNLTERRVVDLSNLGPGRYIVKFNHGESVETKSIVIMK